ncbi:hypothetical protein CRUP_009948 [Coryphaenoides rupestris]|nr:hypothetical protein CRUP_009948 [Coryphaenoides rupestris]
MFAYHHQEVTAPAWEAQRREEEEEEREEEVAEEDQEGVRKNNEHHHQAWSCSRRGHLTLQDRGVHLIATKDSALVFLSKEHKQDHKHIYLSCSALCLFCRSMPSSFKGQHGKIVYKLEAKLARKWKLDRSAEEVLNFTSRSISNHSHLMARQVGATDKDVGVFSKGSVHMDASIDSSVYSPGNVTDFH